MNIQQLTASEKIILVEQLWDSVRAESNTIPLTVEQQQLLDLRLSAMETDGETGDSWEQVLARVSGSGVRNIQ
jgi:putative addiction module component (TIGR02574 family)